ncbi:MAG TPA: hypothetical protein VIM89_11385 [Mucilaginibacter sp.]
MKKIKIRFSLLLFSFAIAITSCSVLRGNYTKNWHGSDNPGHIYASFDGFNGHQDFNAMSFSGTKMKVKYLTDITAGTMALEVKCNGTPVLIRDVTGSIRDSVTFDNPNHNPVQFTLKAKNAAGKFDITY